jgi:hypothetical protein
MAARSEDILAHVREEEWDELHEMDQLKTEMSENGFLDGFEGAHSTCAVARLAPHSTYSQMRVVSPVGSFCTEGTLDFPPTYKYKVIERSENIARKTKAHLRQLNAREYDDNVSVAKMHSHHTGIRKPAWTDRILYKSLPGTVMKCTKYDCDDSLASSSHSPVFGTFVMAVEKPPHHSIQMRRGYIIIRSISLHDLQNAPPENIRTYDAKFRLNFVDDVMEPDFRWQDKWRKKCTLRKMEDGSFHWEGKLTLGPILCRPQSLRCEYMTMKLRNKSYREGHCALCLRDAVNQRHPQANRAPIVTMHHSPCIMSIVLFSSGVCACLFWAHCGF